MTALLRQIIAFILTNLGLSQQIVGIVTGIDTTVQSLAAHATYETTPYYIQDRVVASLGDLENITYGLNALHNQLTAIQTAIADIPTTGTPVTLPTTPPAGYGGGTGASASDIWAFPLPSSGQAASDQLDNAGNLARNLSILPAAFQSQNASMFTLSGTWLSNSGPDNALGGPQWDWTAILSYDTLLTFLERTSGYTGWYYDSDNHAAVRQDVSFNDFIWTTLMDELEFHIYRDAKFPSSGATVPPVWPGVDRVTMGSPVALGVGITIGVPMSGVIIVITSVPDGTNFFDFDGTLSYRNLGALTFYSNNGDFETPQNIGLDDGVYTAKSMTFADGVRIRCKAGVVGTVTPWITLV